MAALAAEGTRIARVWICEKSRATWPPADLTAVSTSDWLAVGLNWTRISSVGPLGSGEAVAVGVSVTVAAAVEVAVAAGVALALGAAVGLAVAVAVAVVVIAVGEDATTAADADGDDKAVTEEEVLVTLAVFDAVVVVGPVAGALVTVFEVVTEAPVAAGVVG